MSQVTSGSVLDQTAQISKLPDEQKLISDVRNYQRLITARDTDLDDHPYMDIRDRNRMLREIADLTAKRDAAQAIINSLRKHH